MNGMYDDRNVCEPRRQPSHKSSLGCVGMNDSVVFTSQEVTEADQAGQVPLRPYLSPDYVQIHQTETVLSYGSLERRDRW